MSRDLWPLPYHGIPSILSTLSITLFALAGCMINYGYLTIVFFIIGLILGLLSNGNSVSIDNSNIILRYGFPKAFIKITISDICGIVDVSAIERGSLLKYFKAPIYTAVILILVPVLYVIARGLIPNPIYIPLITLPLIIGLILIIAIAYTGTSYKVFIRRLGLIVGSMIGLTAFIIGMLYYEVYGTSIFGDSHAFILAFICLMLLGISTVLFIALYQKHHIIVVKASSGYYAIGAVSEEKALEFIKSILEVIKRA